MNHQLIFKKLALSALLVSAVAAPTVTNAASEPKTVSPEVLSQIANTPATYALTTTFIADMSSWANPLELVKTYSPNTLEDWEKTLEQYKKVAGEMAMVVERTIATPLVAAETVNIDPSQAFEINIDDMMAVESTIATPLVAAETANIDPGQAFEINIDDVMAVGSTIATTITAAEGNTTLGSTASEDMMISGLASVTGVLGQFSEVDQAFTKARIALNDAAKSKDATAIKEALAKLLVQYKQQIVDFETAK